MVGGSPERLYRSTPTPDAHVVPPKACGLSGQDRGAPVVPKGPPIPHTSSQPHSLLSKAWLPPQAGAAECPAGWVS